MAQPVRFPSGVSTYPPKNTLASFPSVPAINQASLVNEFIPYRAGDFTPAQTNGAGAWLGWNNGGLTISTTGATAADKIIFGMNAQCAVYMPGNQLWTSVTIAVPSTISDTNVYMGEANTQDITNSPTDGVYFWKPTGGMTVNLVVKKGGTTTQFTNIADLSKPSGIYGDATSTAGTLSFNTSGTTLTSIAVATHGSGYQQAPYLQVTGTGGTGAQAYCQLRSGGLYAPYVTAAGSGYTAGTFAANILPWITLSKYYDGKGTLYIGVNGKTVMSIGPQGQTSITAGGTATNASFKSYYVTNQLTTGQAPVQPKAGAFDNMMPMVPMYPGGGFTNTTTNARTAYMDSFQLGFEYN